MATVVTMATVGSETGDVTMITTVTNYHGNCSYSEQQSVFTTINFLIKCLSCEMQIQGT